MFRNSILIWLHQLCKKLAKETIFYIWRNIFLVLLIYQLFGYYLLEQNPIEIIVDKISVLDFAKIVTEIYFSFLQILNIVSFNNFLHS